MVHTKKFKSSSLLKLKCQLTSNLPIYDGHQVDYPERCPEYEVSSCCCVEYDEYCHCHCCDTMMCPGPGSGTDWQWDCLPALQSLYPRVTPCYTGSDTNGRPISLEQNILIVVMSNKPLHTRMIDQGKEDSHSYQCLKTPRHNIWPCSCFTIFSLAS